MARSRRTTRLGGHARTISASVKQTSASRDRMRAILSIDETQEIEFDLAAIRPKTRGECVDGPRPCPWAGCRHHLYLDVNEETGSLKLSFPNLEVSDMKESCALDEAEIGGLPLDEVGRRMNVTRERMRQIEVSALIKLRATAVITDLKEEPR